MTTAHPRHRLQASAAPDQPEAAANANALAASAPGAVYERLREDILSLTLRPGAAIVRADIQAEFGISSTPVRDALMRLAAEGLVDIVPQSSTRVSLIDVGEAHAANFLRRSIEIEAVRTLALSPDKSVEPALRALIELQRAEVIRLDFRAFETHDREFHRRMVAAAGAGSLWQLVRARSGHIDRIRRLHMPIAGKMDQTLADHTRIVDAIAAGDPAAAQDAMRNHLSRSIGYSPALRAEHPELFKG